MQITNVNDDVLQDIIEMLDIIDGSSLGGTCSQMQRNYLRIRHKLDRVADVDIIGNQIRITQRNLYGQQRKPNEEWIDIKNVLRRCLLTRMQIRELTVKNTILSLQWCQNIVELISSNTTVHTLNVVLCPVLYLNFQPTFGLFLSAIRAKIIYLDEGAQNYMDIVNVIKTCEDKALKIKYRYRGGIVMTTRQLWGILNIPAFVVASGYLEWHNPDLNHLQTKEDFATNPSHRYDSEEYVKYLESHSYSDDPSFDVTEERTVGMSCYNKGPGGVVHLYEE